VHLVIPTGGLGMNGGVGRCHRPRLETRRHPQGLGRPGLLDSYEIERRQVGDRNVGASRYASQGRRKWRGLWRNLDELVRIAEIEQRKVQ